VRRWSDLVLLRNKVPVSRVTLVKSIDRYPSGLLVIGYVASGSSLILCIILLAVDSLRKKRE
jgi:hypothetical protein